jgi:beta-lactamase regulating signal transducer with metallopeptidase domain
VIVIWALTWFGQTAALVALTAIVVRGPGCRSHAAIRHGAWAVALIASAGLLAWPFVPSAATAPSFVAPPGAAPALTAGGIAPIAIPAAVLDYSSGLAWFWALGTAAGLAVLALDILRVTRLKRQTLPLSAAERKRLGSWPPAGPSRRALRIRWCDALDSPAVLGFVRPVIALPRAQAASLADEQLQQVVLHELAHVRRFDDWWALAERVIVAAAWVNPAVHWARRELSLSREMACDEWVVRRTASPVAYAACLAAVAAFRLRARRLRLAAAATGRPTTLRRRIAGVLELDGHRSSRAAGMISWLAPVAVCVVAAGLLKLPPVFVAAQPAADVIGVSWAGMAATPGSVSFSLAAVNGGPVSASLADRPSSARRPARRLALSSESGGPGQIPMPADAAPGVAPERTEPLQRQALDANPVTGAGSAGVTAAGIVAGAVPAGAAAGARWWEGPAAVGAAAGDTAATSGRAAASFFKRVGSNVPKLFAR